MIASQATEESLGPLMLQLHLLQGQLDGFKLQGKLMNSPFRRLERVKGAFLLHKILELLERNPGLNQRLHLIDRLCGHVVHDSLQITRLVGTEDLVLIKSHKVAFDKSLQP